MHQRSKWRCSPRLLGWDSSLTDRKESRFCGSHDESLSPKMRTFASCILPSCVFERVQLVCTQHSPVSLGFSYTYGISELQHSDIIFGIHVATVNHTRSKKKQNKFTIPVLLFVWVPLRIQCSARLRSPLN